MTLAELLISAEINPHDFQKGAKYLAQDKLEGFRTFLYSENPLFWGKHYTPQTATTYLDLFEDNTYIALEQPASDWKTPLSIESYTAAWNAAHNVTVKEEENVMCEDVKSEWPKLMQAIWSIPLDRVLIVEFSSEFVGKKVADSFYPDEIDGKYSDGWFSCNLTAHWKPYTIPTQSPSAALPGIPDMMTAQDIVTRLEELKTSLNSVSKDIGELTVKRAAINVEYLTLKDKLLEVI